MKNKYLLFLFPLSLLTNFSCVKHVGCLEFEALEDNTYFYAFHSKAFLESELPNISISKDNNSWEQIKIVDESAAKRDPFIKLNKGEKVYLKGNNPKSFSISEDKYIHFSAMDEKENDLKFTSNGNIMSLIDNGKCFCTTIPCDYCFTYLFGETDYSKCRLVKAPILGATKLTKECYSHMFFNDLDLVEASPLPSTDIKEKCYAYMFSQCTSLKRAPILRSTNTAPYCYDHMFYGNSSLEYIEIHITDWDREGNFPCCFWVSFDGTFKMSEKGIFRCPKQLVPNVSDPNNFSETRIPYHWTIKTF